MKGTKNPTNQSLSRFLDDLDRRDEERRKDLIKTSKHPQFDDEEEKMEKVLGGVQNQG